MYSKMYKFRVSTAFKWQELLKKEVMHIPLVTVEEKMEPIHRERKICLYLSSSRSKYAMTPLKPHTQNIFIPCTKTIFSKAYIEKTTSLFLN